VEIARLYEIYKKHPSVQTDTRKLNSGDLFFALKGPNFNGNQFAGHAIEAGAAFAIVDDPEVVKDERYILTENVLDTLQQLARFHRQQFDIPFIAITGSNGKTTTKELVTAVLRKKFRTYATEGNLNNHIGVPLTLLKVGMDAEMVVVEMGANHQKEIEGYCRVALPTHGIITNCGKAHIEGFGGEEGVRKGKGELYDFLRENKGTVFRNTDLSYLEEMAKGIPEQITYGSANAWYIGKTLSGDLMLRVAILTTGSETTIKSNLVGEYNFPNVMVAVAVGRHFGIDVNTVKDAIESYMPDNSRSQLLQLGSNKIILDAYNANPTSMRAAISNMQSSGLQRRILWIGAMKEMGKDEEKEHKELVEFLDRYSWDDVILVGREFREFRGRHKWFADSAEAARFVRDHRPDASSILIKGSRGSRMELLLDALKSE